MDTQIEDSEKLKAAYALNLWTVSISQIVDYNDVNILTQEYDTIMSNLNLENMPKDEALLDVIKEIMDTISSFKIAEGDRAIAEKAYQSQLRNAIWSAIPSVSAIFATRDPVALGISLATQVGTGYMNYRRNKAEIEREHERSEWEISRNRLEMLNGLRKQLFETAWRLADKYEFPDEYRLTDKQIDDYNAALIEANPVSRYTSLNAMKESFQAYPTFWYQMGSTANSIYQGDIYAADSDKALRESYRDRAVKCFEKYRELNKFNLLRNDALTSSWALEYLELLGLNRDNDPAQATELIKLAERYSGGALDVLELCAFEYLRLQDYDNAERIFLFLVNKQYNAVVNTQILSSLYIKQIFDSSDEIASKAKRDYRELFEIAQPNYSEYILEIPPEGTDMSCWSPEWYKGEDPEELIQQQKKLAEEREKAKIKARRFYQKPSLIVFPSSLETEAEYFLGFLNENINQIDPALPAASQCTMKEYLHKKGDFERSGERIIMLGDSAEAKKLYKKIKNEEWDYDELGMKFVSHGNKTVLLTRALKNSEISSFIELAKEVCQKYSLEIPEKVQTVHFNFMKNLFGGELYDAVEGAAAVVAGVVMSPVLVLGQFVELLDNGGKAIRNGASSKELRFLQYCVLIDKYLGSEEANIL